MRPLSCALSRASKPRTRACADCEVHSMWIVECRSGVPFVTNHNPPSTRSLLHASLGVVCTGGIQAREARQHIPAPVRVCELNSVSTAKPEPAACVSCVLFRISGIVRAGILLMILLQPDSTTKTLLNARLNAPTRMGNADCAQALATRNCSARVCF